MTKLNKRVAREVPVKPDGARPIVVAIIPADDAHSVPALLEFREKGRRTKFTLPVGAAYLEAVRRELERRKAERRKARQKKREVARGWSARR